MAKNNRRRQRHKGHHKGHCGRVTPKQPNRRRLEQEDDLMPVLAGHFADRLAGISPPPSPEPTAFETLNCLADYAGIHQTGPPAPPRPPGAWPPDWLTVEYRHLSVPAWIAARHQIEWMCGTPMGEWHESEHGRFAWLGTDGLPVRVGAGWPERFAGLAGTAERLRERGRDLTAEEGWALRFFDAVLSLDPDRIFEAGCELNFCKKALKLDYASACITLARQSGEPCETAVQCWLPVVVTATAYIQNSPDGPRCKGHREQALSAVGFTMFATVSASMEHEARGGEPLI